MLRLCSTDRRPLTFERDSRRLCTLLALMLLAGVLQSCSGEASLNSENARGNPDTAKDRSASLKEYPLGAAAALSLAGSPISQEGGPFEKAVACAAALSIASEIITRVGLGTGDKEVNALREAENLFRRQALAESAGIEERGQHPSEAVAALVLQEKENPAAQLKLAAACVQALETPN